MPTEGTATSDAANKNPDSPLPDTGDSGVLSAIVEPTPTEAESSGGVDLSLGDPVDPATESDGAVDLSLGDPPATESDSTGTETELASDTTADL